MKAVSALYPYTLLNSFFSGSSASSFSATLPLIGTGLLGPVVMDVLKKRIMLSQLTPLAKMGWLVTFLKLWGWILALFGRESLWV
jgi:hypothetical protein